MDILVAIDRSEESWNALERAFEVVDVRDAGVTAIHIVEGETSTDEDSSTETSDPEALERGESILRDASKRARSRDVTVGTELRVGDPTEIVPEYARVHDVDVIYIGHRGLPPERESQSDESHQTLGSVAKGVLENTSVPVTVFDREI